MTLAKNGGESCNSKGHISTDSPPSLSLFFSVKATFWHSLWELYTIAPNLHVGSERCLRQHGKIPQLGLNEPSEQELSIF